MFILKIRNSDITIIATDEKKKLKLNCNKFEKTNVILGVYKFKNSENCTINDQMLNSAKHYNKELIFENINLNIKKYQISNKTLELEQIREQEILINEIPLIEKIEVNSGKQIMTNIAIIISITTLIIILCKKPIITFIRRIRFKLTMGELSNAHTTESTNLNLTRQSQIGIPLTQ